MKTKLVCLVALLFVLVGCGVVPQDGVWGYGEYKASKNNCNGDIVSNGNGNFKLVSKGGGKYTISAEDGSNPFECTLSGNKLSCPERAVATQSLGGTEIKVVVTATATLESPTTMSGTQDGTATCTGSGCTLASTTLGISFPCDFSVSFSAIWKSAP